MPYAIIVLLSLLAPYIIHTSLTILSLNKYKFANFVFHISTKLFEMFFQYFIIHVEIFIFLHGKFTNCLFAIVSLLLSILCYTFMYLI